MGNWHCIPSSCAEVVYQEYLPPVIRWRYSGETWQEINGDSYSLEQEKGKCFKSYQVTVSWVIKRCYQDFIISQNTDTRTITGQIIGVDLRIFNNTAAVLVDYKRANGVIAQQVYFSTTRKIKETNCSTNSINNQTRPYLDDVNKVLSSYSITNIQTVDGSPDNCAPCIFKVFKQGQIVYQETRSVCPEVEKLPCRLSSNIKRIEINKLPFLERIEVVPYGYRNFGGGVYQAIIPDECLNIYNNLTTSIIPQFEGFPTPTNASEATYGFIAQICSAPGCPPPEYQVLCDSCGCENCPPGTRAVTCGDSICCYGSDGVSVQEIPASDYCGGGDCE